MNIRAKGARGERQWRDELRSNGYEARRGQQFCGSPESPDVVCEALPWTRGTNRGRRDLFGKSTLLLNGIKSSPDPGTPRRLRLFEVVNSWSQRWPWALVGLLRFVGEILPTAAFALCPQFSTNLLVRIMETQRHGLIGFYGVSVLNLVLPLLCHGDSACPMFATMFQNP